MTSEMLVLKRRRTEHRWRATHLTVHKGIFVKEWAAVEECIRNSLQACNSSGCGQISGLEKY